MKKNISTSKKIIFFVSVVLVCSLIVLGYLYYKKSYEKTYKLSDAYTLISYNASESPSLKLPSDIINIPIQSTSFKIAYSTKEFVEIGENYLDGYVIFLSNTSKLTNTIDGVDTFEDALARTFIYTGVIDEMENAYATPIYKVSLKNNPEETISLDTTAGKKKFTRSSGKTTFSYVSGNEFKDIFNEFKNLQYNYYGYMTTDNNGRKVFIVALDLSKDQHYVFNLISIMPKVIKTYKESI